MTTTTTPTSDYHPLSDCLETAIEAALDAQEPDGCWPGWLLLVVLLKNGKWTHIPAMLAWEYGPAMIGIAAEVQPLAEAERMQ